MAYSGLETVGDLPTLNFSGLTQRTADGVEIRNIIEILRAKLIGADNNRLFNPPAQFIANYLLTPPTSETIVRYRAGQYQFGDATEQGAIDWQRRSSGSGAVLPIRKELAVGWTQWALDELLSTEAEADMESIVMAAIHTRHLNMLGLAFNAAAVRTGAAGVKSPTWVGADGQTYVPDAWNSATPITTHILASGADSAAGRRATFASMGDILRGHGFTSEDGAPILLLHGSATRADVVADSQYMARPSTWVSYGNAVNVANLRGLPDLAVHGLLQDSGALCVQIGQIPDNYFLMVKSMGFRSPMNPIRDWRPARWPSGYRMIQADGSVVTGVVEKLNGIGIAHGFGYAVRAPEMGVLGLIGGGGTYTDPTF